ncbi:CPBP family intramembrane glutamic endopeptidase [Methylobacterium sp. JK268]
MSPLAGRRRAVRIALVALRPLLFLVAAGLLAFGLVTGAARLLQGRGLTVGGFPFSGFDAADRYALTFAVVPLPLLAALVVWRARARFGPGWGAALGLVAPRGRGLALALLLWPPTQVAWVAALAALAGHPAAAAFRFPPALTGTAFAVWLAWLLVLAPVAEELLFRGDLFARGAALLGPGPLVALSAGLFALSHGTGGLGHPLSVLPLGLVLGLLRLRSGSLFACMALHAANNGAVVLTMLLLALP